MVLSMFTRGIRMSALHPNLKSPRLLLFRCHADAAFPLLPAKSYSLFRDNSAEFIEARRAGLETWIRSVFESFPSVLISPPLAGLLKLR